MCDPKVKVTNGKPEFIKKEQNIFVIEFKTSVVCGSVDIDCTVTSKDNQHYDLNPLTLQDGRLFQGWIYCGGVGGGCTPPSALARGGVHPPQPWLGGVYTPLSLGLGV